MPPIRGGGAARAGMEFVIYVYLAAAACAASSVATSPLAARGRVPRAVRGLPSLLARRSSAHRAARPPVSLLHAETALAQLGGVTELIDQGVAEA